MSVNCFSSGATGTTAPVLLVEDLQQRLRDPQSGEEFVVTVEGRLTVEPGSFAAILGPSGCGKTTLLTVLGLLRRPSDPRAVGRFEITGLDSDSSPHIHDLKDLWLRNRQRRIERLRRRHIGFALQSGELLSSLKVWENVAVPLRLNGIGGHRCRSRVDELLSAFGLNGEGTVPNDDRLPSGARLHCNSRLANARVNKLSGGEYQRVVLARAIAHRPRLVFVDEPTSSLNRELARAALQQLKCSQLSGDHHGAVVMITHDEALAADFADTIVRMAPEKGRAAGRVVEIVSNRGAA